MFKESIVPYSDQFSQNDQPERASDLLALNGDGAALPDLKVTDLAGLGVMTEFLTEASQSSGPTVVDNPNCSAEDGQCLPG